MNVKFHPFVCFYSLVFAVIVTHRPYLIFQVIPIILWNILHVNLAVIGFPITEFTFHLHKKQK